MTFSGTYAPQRAAIRRGAGTVTAAVLTTHKHVHQYSHRVPTPELAVAPTLPVQFTSILASRHRIIVTQRRSSITKHADDGRGVRAHRTTAALSASAGGRA